MKHSGFLQVKKQAAPGASLQLTAMVPLSLAVLRLCGRPEKTRCDQQFKPGTTGLNVRSNASVVPLVRIINASKPAFPWQRLAPVQKGCRALRRSALRASVLSPW